MEKEFIPYGLALRLKGVGFDELCSAVYFGNGENELFTFNPSIAKESTIRMVELGHIPCPTFSQVFRWFRDNHRMFHEVFIDTEPTVDKPDKLEFAYLILHMVGPEHMYTDKIKGKRYDTYEESELACLERLIEIIEKHEKSINI